MNTESEQPTILPWHREAAKEINKALLRQNPTVSAIIARHDPHATTLRLLEDAADQIESGEQDTFGLTAYQANLCKEIRAHLAALSKPAAMQQSAKQEGTQ